MSSNWGLYEKVKAENEKMAAKAGNGFEYTRAEFRKFVNLEGLHVLQVKIGTNECKKVYLSIIPGERWSENSCVITLDFSSSIYLYLTEPQKRRNNNLLAKFTHDYPDEKILEMWEAHTEKKGA